jgi:hypothetical protein
MYVFGSASTAPSNLIQELQLQLSWLTRNLWRLSRPAAPAGPQGRVKSAFLFFVCTSLFYNTRPRYCEPVSTSHWDRSGVRLVSRLPGIKGQSFSNVL